MVSVDERGDEGGERVVISEAQLAHLVRVRVRANPNPNPNPNANPNPNPPRRSSRTATVSFSFTTGITPSLKSASKVAWRSGSGSG